MKKYLLTMLSTLLIGFMPLTLAQQKTTADQVPPQNAAPAIAATGKEAPDKGKERGSKAESAQNQREAVKSRRDHRRTVNHRLRRRV